MTKKDYELIAEVFSRQVDVMQHLADYHNKVDEPVLAKQHLKAKREIQQLATSIGFELEKQNSRFNAEKWAKATGANRI